MNITKIFNLCSEPSQYIIISVYVPDEHSEGFPYQFFSVFLFFCTWVSQLNVQGILPQRMSSLNIRSICVSLILSVHRRKVVIKFAAFLLRTLEAPCSHYCTEICHPKVLKWFSSVHSGKTRYSPQISISFTSLVFSLLFISIKQCK